MINDLKSLKQHSNTINDAFSSGANTVIYVSMGTCGLAAGTESVNNAIQSEITKKNLSSTIEVIETGCMGLCHSEPTIEVFDKKNNQGVIYGNVTSDQIPDIIANNAKSADIIKKTWYLPEKEKKIDSAIQARIVLRNSGRINPEKIDDYIANAGYDALGTVLLEKSPESVISMIEQSGLRGRGGGGFPTGLKWKFAAAQDSAEKYVICNADEGDPGAFMDRAVLEGDPHAVLEAMAITGFAIGANTGIIYIRAEYPLAIKRLDIAIAQANEYGFLGTNIFGSGFNFTIEIRYGAGAFVCGEETALIHSIEGKRGMPTFKPPFPAVEGLWGKPTIVNNVETFANIPTIIRKGAKWFKAIGTEGSPGTKVFALAGKINKVGLIEVPMGTSLKDIIFNIGDGIHDGKKFKAVQTGGPSGGCITTDNLDTPIDYDTLKQLGSMMGSGGMIVMDEDDCMVDIAKFFLDFTMEESCGKCTPCRVGGRQMYKLLEKITKGRGDESDLSILEELSNAIQKTALCGLGMTAPNPILATMRCFKDEYLAHVNDKKCPAGKCAELLTYSIDSEKCVGCTICAKKCPTKCIAGKVKDAHFINQKECIRCGECYAACKFNAIIKE